MLLSRHCARWGLYRVMHVASLSGRPIVCHIAITALRPVGIVPCYACRVPVGTPYRLSYYYHGTAPKACTVLRISRPYRDALSAVMLLSRHCALWSLYRVKHVATQSGRPISHHAAITVLRPRGLVPCYACRVPVGTPYRQSCSNHGTAPCGACTMLCMSRPCRDALSAIILASCPVPIGTRPCITRYKRTESSQCRVKTTNRPASRQGRDTKRIKNPPKVCEMVLLPAPPL